MITLILNSKLFKFNQNAIKKNNYTKMILQDYTKLL